MSYFGKRIRQEGQDLNYTCTNEPYSTNINKGFSHGANNALGSVLDSPLYNDENSSLWLEHVVENSNPTTELYWLMWYNANGVPTINTSAVFGKDEAKRLINMLVNQFLIFQ